MKKAKDFLVLRADIEELILRKKEGKLRLAVPDFENIVKVYLKYKKDINHKGILGPLYGRWSIPGAKKIVYHKTAYDFKSLKKLLEQDYKILLPGHGTILNERQKENIQIALEYLEKSVELGQI